MAKFLFFSLLLSLGCYAAEVELFCDWASDAKGQEICPLLDAPPSDLPLLCLLRKKLNERGDDLKSWEFDRHRPHLIRWESIKNFEDLRSYFRIGLSKEPDAHYWMFWNLGPKLKQCDLARVPKEKLVLVMWEPPTVQPELYDPKTHANFGKIFTWDDDLVDNEKFIKIHYPALVPLISNIPPFEEKKFCVMISRRLKSKNPKELYSMRKKTIDFFENKPAGEFDLFGFYWERAKLKNWRGVLHSSKLEKLKEYKFSICYENMRDVKGYITEKIFDCFGAGVVPVYWGASNVTDYIPAGCFIDRRCFADDDEMYQFLKAMTKEEYQLYLDRIAAFLKSDQAKVFTAEYFIDNYLSELY